MAVYQKKDKNGKVLKDTKGNSWYYRCYYTDMFGARKQRKSKLYETKGKAQEEERLFLQSIKTTDIVNPNVSFEKVYNEFLKVKKEKVKITTYYGIEKEMDFYVFNYFKKYKLHDIKINIINMWKDNLKSKDTTIRWKNNIISHFRELLNYANIYYNYDKKIIDSLTNLRDDTPKDKTKSESNFWTSSEFNQFINTVDNEYYKLIFIFLYRTGLRIGELRALTWNDIDLNKHTLSITKSLSKDTFNKKSIIVTPKTNNSIRTIDLDNYIIEIMKSYYNEQQKFYKFDDSWYIFGGIKYLSSTTLRRYLNYYIEKAKVKHITIHGFRHSHVSLLIEIGCNFNEVASRIGDTISMVQNTYYHMYPERQKNITERLNNIKN